MLSLEEGIKFFNKGDFFEAHDAWEAAWKNASDPVEKQFARGLIMISAAIHHYVRGEYAGFWKLFEKGLNLMEENRHAEAGMDVESFLKETRSFYERIKASDKAIPEERLSFPKIKKPHYV